MRRRRRAGGWPSCTLLVRSRCGARRGNRGRPGVGLGLFQYLGRLGAEALYLGGGELVELPHELGVALGEHGLQDAQHGALFLPGRRVAGGVAHQMHDAALPRGAREDLLIGALEALVGVAGDADHAVDPACAQRQQERLPTVVGLGVDGVEPQKAPVPARAVLMAVTSAVDCTRPASLHLM